MQKASIGFHKIAPSNAMNDLTDTFAKANMSSSSTREDSPENLDTHEDEPLKTFHPFPQLPTELRIQIWTLALPSDKRLYTLSISIPASSALLPTPTFLIHHAASNHSSKKPTISLTRSTALLLTNHESRSIYLSHHPSFIPTTHQAKLHFSPTQTIFHITNYKTLQRNVAFAQSIKSNTANFHHLKTLLSGIHFLATTKDSFYPSVERGAWWGGSGGGPSIRIFPNLETWYCVLGEGGSRAAAEEETRRTRGRLEGFGRRFDSEWNVPGIELLEL
ncbi:hypothetical protein ONS95_010053 [Cadophora gregata]|uniref:uncharacterized protein n=1 Tax=Cadophora gregata TaxID=51156 RepID=UPI0026DC0283|nr:uncharacterized protein ONS95_010053 [Cadophora gregata]KAK0121767.1 hypothetical protein ONS95_010053 [Cadophora gregata]KAK0127244.1 hypothetical protein ONS96_006796 [Cadophora gregata f. sp. sojae]